MMTITFDTHEFVKRLKAAGMPEEQAEVVTDAIRDSRNLDLSHLATKQDLQLEIKALEIRLIKWMVGVAAAVIGILFTLLRLFP